MSASATKPTVQNLPTDPDDDDLDELDDVLSQFTTTTTSGPESSSQISTTTTTSQPLSPPPPPPPTASTATTSGRPRNNTRVDAVPTSIPGLGSTSLDTTHEEEELDFARELAKGMENLMRELSVEAEGSTGTTKSTDDDGSLDPSAESARALKAVWEQMLIEGMDGNMGTGQHETSTGGGGGAGGGRFQDKIKQAVNKLKESESSLQADKKPRNGATAEPTAESLEALLNSLGDLGLGEDGDEKELAGLLENMMGELMSKSILYEPLSELAQGFPPYLKNPPSPLSDEDRKRYDLQLGCVRRILTVFDQAGYDDKDAKSQQQIADLMAEMQNYGSPPSELMGPLPDAEGCTIT